MGGDALNLAMPADATIVTWSAVPRRGIVEPATPDPRDGWLPLVAVPGGIVPAPGWARISWEPNALHVDALFRGAVPHNRALRLNERTWELGDAFEFFLQLPDSGDYVEIHVTPENQRLQLRWPPGVITRVRAKQAKLESFLVRDPGWVASHTRVEGQDWLTHLRVPVAALAVPPLQPAMRFRAAVCRYHCCANQPEPVLSTTAPLPTPGFHQPAAWHVLTLGGDDSPSSP